MIQVRPNSTPHKITLVTSPGCHLCEIAKDVIGDASDDYELTTNIVDLASPEGQHLARIHRMPFPPLLLIDEKLHGHGRISAKKLRRTLELSNPPAVRKA